MAFRITMFLAGVVWARGWGGGGGVVGGGEVGEGSTEFYTGYLMSITYIAMVTELGMACRITI